MLPFEFIVDGPPVSHQTRHAIRLHLPAHAFVFDGDGVSHQTRHAIRLHAWQHMMRTAATYRWPANMPPVRVRLSFMVTYYHDGVSVRIDNDNLVKPIQDALNGLVYEDDRQITDTYVRKTDLNGSFRVRGMSPVLAEGFCRGNEFLYIRIDVAPDHEELI